MTPLPRIGGRRRLFRAGLPPLRVAAGCSPPRLRETGRHAGPPLRAPERIFVVDLGVLPDDVRLDQGAREGLVRTVSSETPDAARLAAGRRAAGALAEETALRLRGYGPPADTGAEGRRIGDALALRLGRLFTEPGWVSASAVR